MKVVVTGSLGKISRPLTQIVVKAGHQVTVVSSKKEKTAEIQALGANAAIGSVEDSAFLTSAFTAADAVYTMVPPNFAAENLRGYISGVGNNYAKAIRATGVKKIVNLSSIGAHLPEGTGPIKGLYDVEHTLDALDGVAVNPADISGAAAEEIEQPFTGKAVRYVVSDERTAGEAAAVLGAAIGKPELKWVEFSDADALGGMRKAGLPEEMANNYTEMGTAVGENKLWDDYIKHKPAVLGKRKFAEFAREFATAYNG
jgi:uncharacterized protein YbjT (DUF2867 family)